VAGEGDEVMFAWRSFEAYPSLVRIAGATPVMVPLDASEHRHDLDAMLAAITERTRLSSNPNNPTGTVVGPEELERFVAAVPRDVLVVIDEAYVHFDGSAYFADAPGATDPERGAGLELFRRHPHVAVLHTFSKAYGLAGLRIGYAIAPAADRRCAQGRRALRCHRPGPGRRRRLARRAGRARRAHRRGRRAARPPARRARRRGAAVRSQANFVWVPAGSAPSSSTASCTRAASSPAPSRARVRISAPPRTSTASRRLARRTDPPTPPPPFARRRPHDHRSPADHDHHEGPAPGLTRRQISMMGLGGAIGAGLFVGSGQAIGIAGPAVIVLLVAGTIVVLVMAMLAEMVAANPSSGAFSSYAQKAMGRSVGSAVGWLYWIQLVVVIAAEATGAAGIVAHRFPGLPEWAWVLLFVLALTVVNLLGVRNYGRFEFWFAAIKVAAIIAFSSSACSRSSD
jgi:histidinol-phosphate/aromatic aminotransferase/cobyric acid decarboxylase-like protein